MGVSQEGTQELHIRPKLGVQVLSSTNIRCIELNMKQKVFKYSGNKYKYNIWGLTLEADSKKMLGLKIVHLIDRVLLN